jgi:non-ribosomal peptide synthase protein (TIGR01720 family)
VEGHGREDVFEELDLSRTVGWFTSLFPVALCFVSQDPATAVSRMQSRLRAIPSRGFGFGVLRYLGSKSMPSDWRDPQLCFNYLGQLNVSDRSKCSMLSLASEQVGILSDPSNRRAHLIDVVGAVRNGCIEFDWTFSQNFHRRNSVENLAQRYVEALTNLIDHAKRPKQAGARSATAQYDPVVAIQSGNRRGEPIFCVPGIGGSVIYFSPLAHRLGGHVPVYGMQPRGFDGDIPPHTTITEMAEAYVDAISGMKIDPSRRMRLLGHSLGAMVVFEMARRLRSMDFQLAPIVLLDPPTLLEMATAREKPDPETMLSMIVQFLTNRYGALFEGDEQTWSKLDEDGRIEFLRQKMIGFKLISARTPFDVIRSKVRMIMAHGHLDYWPSGVYPDEVAILRPTKDFVDAGADDRDPSTGWIRFAPRLRVLESDGDHMTILDHATMTALMRNLSSIWGDEEEPRHINSASQVVR